MSEPLGLAQRKESRFGPRDVESIAQYRRARNARIADALERAAIEHQSVRARGVSHLLRMCGSESNIWIGANLHNEETGELYSGVGTLAACGSRLCPSCLAADRRRARARVRLSLQQVKPSGDAERWRFVTLTLPTLPGQSLLSVLALVQRAFSLLRKRKVWAESVRAGVKGVEFTVNKRGYHVHIHALILSRWIEWKELGEVWTDCLQTAWTEAGLQHSVDTRSGRAVVDIRLVRPKRSDRKDSIGLDDAIHEVVKYLTKSESWEHLPAAHLVEVAEAKRWPRMFEVFGAARCPSMAGSFVASGDAISPQPTQEKPGPPEGDTSLDTQSLSDGQQLPGLERAEPLLKVLENTVFIQNGEWDGWEGWLHLAELRILHQRDYRKNQLVKRYPYALFTLASGESFCLASKQIERKKDIERSRRSGDARAALLQCGPCSVCGKQLVVDDAGDLFCTECKENVFIL